VRKISIKMSKTRAHAMRARRWSGVCFPGREKQSSAHALSGICNLVTRRTRSFDPWTDSQRPGKQTRSTLPNALFARYLQLASPLLCYASKDR
jgi:hypothetical protein